jgi:hypothetical protein
MHSKFRDAIGGVVGLVVSGISVGWLTGLSVSPVVQTVVASTVGALVLIVALLAGVPPSLLGSLARKSPPSEPDPAATPGGAAPFREDFSVMPMALLLVGLSVGAALGISARTNAWFGVRPRRQIERWAAVGMRRDNVAKRLFDSAYPPEPRLEDQRSNSAQFLTGVLHAFNGSQDGCESLRITPDNALQNEISKTKEFREFAQSTQDVKVLRAFVNAICPAN